MSVSVVRLGSPRHAREGLRIGTVRRPPRGVSKAHLRDWYDVWLPQLAPSADLVKEAQSAQTPADWKTFARKYRKEMSTPDNAHLLDFLATLSRTTNFSVGCYCEDENHCHRSLLRELLREHGADFV